jgi:hypothetical protein
MKREKKKQPGDYPQFAFRVSQEEKDEISALVDQLETALNKGRADDERKIRKNDVIVDALMKGLLQMRRGLKS